MKLINIKTATAQTAIKLLGIVFPPIAIAEASGEYLNNISNYILLEKIKRFVEAQDSDFEEWLKASCDYQKDSSKYEATVKMLIYVIESINDDMKIDVYANLMRAYKSKLLEKSLFLKLSSMLPAMFYDDLLFLKNYVDKEIKEIFEDDNFFSVAYANLLNYGLVYCNTEGLYIDTRGSKTFRITIPGLEMVRCGIDYDNYDKYRNVKVVYEVHESDHIQVETI